MSQEHVAYEMGLTQGSISNYEVGRSDIPLTVLLRLCTVLRTTPADLVPTIPPGWTERVMDPVPDTHLIP